jgi:hypothetical protein
MTVLQRCPQEARQSIRGSDVHKAVGRAVRIATPYSAGSPDHVIGAGLTIGSQQAAFHRGIEQLRTIADL